MIYCGMDVHKKYIRVSQIDEEGDVIGELKLRTKKKFLQRQFDLEEPMRIVLETGTHAAWIARTLRDLGHEVIVAHARRIQLICQSRKKDDRTDAEVLARLGRSDLDLLIDTHVRGEAAQRIRTMLNARRALVESRTKLSNQVRSTVRQAGFRLPDGDPARLPELIEESEIEPILLEAVRPLAEMITELTEQIEEYEETLKEIADRIDVVKRLRQIDGVGWQTALCFVVTIEKPGRFQKSKKVAAYVGLDPTVRNSGNEDSDENNTGSISKRGDSLLRWLLVQAGHSLMRTKKDSELKQFAERIKERKCTQVAAVAAARKIAVLMHVLWVTQRDYERFYHRDNHAA